MNLFEWAEFKAFVDQRLLPVNYINFDNRYHLWAFDGPLHLCCKVRSNDAADADQIDFETNYKPSANVKISDGDGAVFARPKAATKGWTFGKIPVEFSTSTIGAIYSKDYTDTSRTTITHKIYNNVDAEITLQANEGTAVKTVVDLELPYDIEVIGGGVYQETIPTTDIRVWVVAVPDVPAPQGSKEMVGGANLKLLSTGAAVSADGRVTKKMTYNATYHTNKFRFILRHDAGVKHEIMVIMDVYRL